jgi:hypothetical protein
LQIALLTTLILASAPAAPPVTARATPTVSNCWIGRDWKEGCNLTVRGVKLNATYADVVRQLGTPEKQRAPDRDRLDDESPIHTLEYAGLEVGVLCSPDRQVFEAVRISVSSPEWSVEPGVKVGMTRSQVIEVPGDPTELDVTDPKPQLWYRCQTIDAFATIELDKDRVERITWEFELY